MPETARSNTAASERANNSRRVQECADLGDFCMGLCKYAKARYSGYRSPPFVLGVVHSVVISSCVFPKR